jgi:cytochrome c oxidase assembly factor CtaG
LVLGDPATTFVRALPPSVVGRALRAVTARRGGKQLVAAALSPLVVGLLFNANLVLWHLPPAYDAALRDPWIHDLEHAGFFGSALMLWWMVLEPFQRHAPAPSHAAYGLSFASCMAGGTVALALIFAPFPIYPWYQGVINPWGLSALADQRAGGLIMALGGAIYLAMLFALLQREVDRPARGRGDGASG